MVSGTTGALVGLSAQALPYAEMARDAKGETIASVTMRAGIGYGIPIGRIRRWLEAHAFAYTATGEEGALSGRKEGWLSVPQRRARLHQGTGRLLYSMARVLRHDTDLLDMAVYHFTHSRNLEPSQVDAVRYLGLALADAGDLVGSRVHMDEALRLSPGNPQVYTDLGDLAWQGRDRREAERWYRDALRHAPCDARASARLHAIKHAADVEGKRGPLPEFTNSTLCPPPSLSASHLAGLELLELGLHTEVLRWYEVGS